MSKKELIDSLSAKTGETKRATEATIAALTNHITDALKSGAEVALPGIGKLRISARPERPGRNPRTGEAAVIPASNAVKFKASSVLINAVN